MQSALFVENLAVKFANTGDIDELQHGLDKLHNEPQQPGKQKHKGSEKVEKSNDEEDPETNYATFSKAIQFHNWLHVWQERNTFGWQV